MWSKRLDPGLEKAKQEAKNRDGRKCKWPGCGKRKKLQMHHILPYSANPGLRCEPGNLICLCKDHHKIVTGNELSWASFLFSLITVKK